MGILAYFLSHPVYEVYIRMALERLVDHSLINKRVRLKLYNFLTVAAFRNIFPRFLV